MCRRKATRSPRRRHPRARMRSVVLRALLRPEAGGVASAALVFAFFAIMAGQNGFVTPLGTANWLDTAADLGIVALAIGMLMIGGEFDLSVGSVVGAASMIVAICTGYFSLNPWIGVDPGLHLRGPCRRGQRRPRYPHPVAFLHRDARDDADGDGRYARRRDRAHRLIEPLRNAHRISRARVRLEIF